MSLESRCVRADAKAISQSGNDRVIPLGESRSGLETELFDFTGKAGDASGIVSAVEGFINSRNPSVTA